MPTNKSWTLERITFFVNQMKAYFRGKSVWYGTCATAAGTQKKVVTINGITALETGLSIRIKFANAQTYNGTPTLELNSLGAKNIRYKGDANGVRYLWNAWEVVDFVYDGTYWVMQMAGMATTTYYGRTKLSSSVTSTSAALAATPLAVKTAYDLADGKAAKVAGAATGNLAGLDGNGDLTDSGVAPADVTDRLLIPTTAFAIPAAGSSVSYDLDGLTANHELLRWNFSQSEENDPPVDLSWYTYDGYFVITNDGGATSETVQPVFGVPTAAAISTHSLTPTIPDRD